MTTRTRFLIGAVALVVSAVAITFSTRANNPQTGASVLSLDVSFRYLDGTEGNLADFVGKPVVVNFWASWCPACVAELPDFENVHTRLGDRVVFLGFNMQEVDPQAADALIEESGVTYRLAHDRDGSILADFGGIAMPTTVLLDELGNVATVHSGAIFAEDLEALIRRELLET